MSLKFSTNTNKSSASVLTPKIIVIGVGGAGCNAVNNMIESGVAGVDFVVANTDNQALTASLCTEQIQLGVSITNGLGAGSVPEIGKKATEESLDEIIRYIESAHMVFVTAGMGGGTGTGGAPVIAKLARERGILTVGVVTKPFEFEQSRRMESATKGIQQMEENCDTLIVIPNQNLFRVSNESTTFKDAFKMADQVLVSGVRCNTDLITTAGIINLDFADVAAIMSNMGRAVMGEGYASGENRAVNAADAAITNPLLEYSSIKGATGALINVAGGPDLTLFEVNDAIKRVTEEISPNANVKFGSVIRKELEGTVHVSVVATGISMGSGNKLPPEPSILGKRTLDMKHSFPESDDNFGSSEFDSNARNSSSTSAKNTLDGKDDSFSINSFNESRSNVSRAGAGHTTNAAPSPTPSANRNFAKAPDERYHNSVDSNSDNDSIIDNIMSDFEVDQFQTSDLKNDDVFIPRRSNKIPPHLEENQSLKQEYYEEDDFEKELPDTSNTKSSFFAKFRKK